MTIWMQLKRLVIKIRKRGQHGIFGLLNQKSKEEAKLPEYGNNSGARDHQLKFPNVRKSEMIHSSLQSKLYVNCLPLGWGDLQMFTVFSQGHFFFLFSMDGLYQAC